MNALIIIGKGDSRVMAKHYQGIFNEPVVWTLNDFNSLEQLDIKSDCHFELHAHLSNQNLAELNARASQVILNAGLKINSEALSETLGSEFKNYPFDFVKNELGDQMCYFKSTISYMLGLAIASCEFDYICLPGVDMATEDESFTDQRTDAERLIAFGLGRGIKFLIPETSTLFKNTKTYELLKHS